MPTSTPDQISKIVTCIVDLNPKSVLDIGFGFGKYGFLSREYLEVWGKESNYGKFSRRIDGIEIYKKYITGLQRKIYDNIYIGDVFKVLNSIKTKYDLILLVDVLEHLSKKDGEKLIRIMKKKGKNVLIATPKFFIKQQEVFGNIHETHKCVWTKRELKKFGKTFFIRDSISHVVLMTNDEDLVKLKKRSRLRRINSFIMNAPLSARVFNFISVRNEKFVKKIKKKAYQ